MTEAPLDVRVLLWDFLFVFFGTFVSYMVVHSLYMFVCCMVGMLFLFIFSFFRIQLKKINSHAIVAIVMPVL